MLDLLLELVAFLVPLSLVAMGGGNSIIPELHRQTVDQWGWVSDAEFAQLFALVRAAPGPNLLMVSLVGWKMAGPVGALVATAAITIPSSVLTYLVTHTWGQAGQATWLRTVRRGLAPVAVGLILASGLLLTISASATPFTYVATLLATVLLLRTRIHPLLLMAATALMAVAGWL